MSASSCGLCIVAIKFPLETRELTYTLHCTDASSWYWAVFFLPYTVNDTDKVYIIVLVLK